MLQHDQFHLHNWNYINYAGSHSTHVSRLHVSFYFQSISFFLPTLHLTTVRFFCKIWGENHPEASAWFDSLKLVLQLLTVWNISFRLFRESGNIQSSQRDGGTDWFPR